MASRIPPSVPIWCPAPYFFSSGPAFDPSFDREGKRALLNLLNIPFVVLAGVILLPLIPAVMLFKLLPSTAVVSGPLQGLRIDLGGAFAAYFALVVLILSTKNSVWDPVPTYQVWTVTGTVTDNNGTPVAPLAVGDISLLPPSLTESNSWFTIDIPVRPGQGGTPDYPTLAIAHAGYQPAEITLNPSAGAQAGVNFDSTTHQVQINGLRLQPLPTYQPAAPLNAQAEVTPGAAQIQPAGAHP
jgi:hypothetical protein